MQAARVLQPWLAVVASEETETLATLRLAHLARLDPVTNGRQELVHIACGRLRRLPRGRGRLSPWQACSATTRAVKTTAVQIVPILGGADIREASCPAIFDLQT